MARVPLASIHKTEAGSCKLCSPLARSFSGGVRRGQILRQVIQIRKMIHGLLNKLGDRPPQTASMKAPS